MDVTTPFDARTVLEGLKITVHLDSQAPAPPPMVALSSDELVQAATIPNPFITETYYGFAPVQQEEIQEDDPRLEFPFEEIRFVPPNKRAAYINL